MYQMTMVLFFVCDIFTTPIFLKQLKGMGHIAVCNNETDCGNQLEFHKKENH